MVMLAIEADMRGGVQVDLVKDNGHLYFIKHLDSHDPALTPESRAQAAFVLSVICDGHPRGQTLCAQADLLKVFFFSFFFLSQY